MSSTVTRSDLTIRQRELARHALGLPNRTDRSYRNRFVCGPGHTDYSDWQQMARLGFAERRGRMSEGSANFLFQLTPRGARAAILSRETLDPEDFPA